MSENLAKVRTEIAAFTSKHNVEAQIYSHSVSELTDGTPQQDERWALFEKNGGVYCIFNASGNTTKYVGMSHIDTGNRLVGWLFSDDEVKGYNKVNDNLKDDDVVLSIVLTKENSYMASSLEMFLIQKLNPKFNVTGKRRNYETNK